MVSPMTTSLATDTFFDAPFLVNISTALIAWPDDIAPDVARPPEVTIGLLALLCSGESSEAKQTP